MDGFEIKVDNQGLVEKLKALDRRVSNLRPFFEEVGEIIKTSIVRNFEVGGRYRAVGDWHGGSLKWQALSTVTLFGAREGIGKGGGKFVEKKSGDLTQKGQNRLAGKKILIQEELLMGSINWRAASAEVEVGSNLAYSAIHNFGGKAGRNKAVTIPGRPYMVVQDEDLEQILQVADEHILGRI